VYAWRPSPLSTTQQGAVWWSATDPLMVCSVPIRDTEYDDTTPRAHHLDEVTDVIAFHQADSKADHIATSAN
jgi:hypothetical protein